MRTGMCTGMCVELCVNICAWTGVKGNPARPSSQSSRKFIPTVSSQYRGTAVAANQAGSPASSAAASFSSRCSSQHSTNLPISQWQRATPPAMPSPSKLPAAGQRHPSWRQLATASCPDRIRYSRHYGSRSAVSHLQHSCFLATQVAVLQAITV